MKYKLYNESTQDVNNIADCVLRNRGITNPYRYLHLDSLCLHDFNLFENMDKAIQIYNKHLDNHNTIAVLCDTDVDGYTSCAEIICYTKDVYSEADIHYVMHERPKAHGLENLDFILPEGCKLLIVPDAGTNDVSTYKEFNKNGIDVLILDHHEVEEEAMEYIKEDHSDEEFTTVIVNNQIGNYPNKNLSGAGVVYKFLQAYDSEFWLDYSEKYIDLCALGNIGDCMDLREEETRYLCDKGLENIQNPFFLSAIKQREFSMGGEININNIQFFIVPLINGCIRVGSQEEKELMLRAFIGENEIFEYKKRATKDKPAEVINEDLPTRSTRLASNAKARQDKLRDKYTTELCEIIADEITDEDRVVMVDGENIDSSLTGVIAIKLAEKFNMPCILMKNHYDKNGNLDYIGGSARNIDNSPIESFKDLLNSCKYASGRG